MRNRDRAQSSQALDARNRLIVDQAHAIPEHIALLVLDQQGPLTDGERWDGPDADQSRLLLFKLIAKTLFLHLSQRCPLLAIVANILALVATDRARLRWLLARRELCAAGYANPVFHLSISSLSDRNISRSRPLTQNLPLLLFARGDFAHTWSSFGH